MSVRGTNVARGIILATLIVAGCSSSGGSDATNTQQESLAPAASESAASSEAAPASEAAASEVPASSAPPSPAFAEIELEGKGDKIAKFTIPEDTAAIAEFTHKGDANFAVATIDASGEQLDLLVNTIGDYNGTARSTGPPGTFRAVDRR